MFELYPRGLEREGLGPALEEVAADGPWQDAQVEVTMPRQSTTLEALCYRTVRELVINARKHSRARHLLVRGWQEDGEVRFLVEDDGVGFDPDRALGDHGVLRHLGLEAVIERVRLAQGELTIESSAGKGSRFLLVLPAAPREG
jgi:signal transduction histidine kinase